MTQDKGVQEDVAMRQNSQKSSPERVATISVIICAHGSDDPVQLVVLGRDPSLNTPLEDRQHGKNEDDQ